MSLQEAALRGDMKAVSVLLWQYSVNHQDNLGATALIGAAREGHISGYTGGYYVW